MKIRMNAHYGLLSHEYETIYAQGKSEICDTGAVELPAELKIFQNRAGDLLIEDAKGSAYHIRELITSRNNRLSWMWYDKDGMIHNILTPWIKGADPNPEYVAIINDRAGTAYEPYEMPDEIAHQYAPELFALADYYIGGEPQQ